MSEARGRLEHWAHELHEIWKRQCVEIEAIAGREQTEAFEAELNSLLSELKEPIRGRDVFELAHEVYETWQRLQPDQQERTHSTRAVPIGGHQLPPLPYAYNALEPYISEEIMRLHHDKHHKSYVDGLNKAEKEMRKARETNNFDLITHWEREAAFNGAGHYLHTIFWEIMSPRGGGEPRGELAQQINRDFGSFHKMKAHFSHAAEKVEGGGWAMLVWSPRSHRLEILQAEKHQNLSQQDIVPLLVLDVWEHAYYLQYKNERKPYIENWWNIVNWPAVERRYQAARKLKWQPF